LNFALFTQAPLYGLDHPNIEKEGMAISKTEICGRMATSATEKSMNIHSIRNKLKTMKTKTTFLVIAISLLIATSCKKQNRDYNSSSHLNWKVYADSLFQASIDSAQIAGASIFEFFIKIKIS